MKFPECDDGATTDTTCMLPLGAGFNVAQKVSHSIAARSVDIAVAVTTSSLTLRSLSRLARSRARLISTGVVASSTCWV